MLAVHFQNEESHHPLGAFISKRHEKSRNTQSFPVHIKDFATHTTELLHL